MQPATHKRARTEVVHADYANNKLRKKPKKRAQSARVGTLSMADLRPVMHLTLEQAAEKLKVGTTVLKRVARKCGISKWPSRQISWLDMKIEEINERLQSATDRRRLKLEEQLAELIRMRKEVHRTGRVEGGISKRWKAKEPAMGGAIDRNAPDFPDFPKVRAFPEFPSSETEDATAEEGDEEDDDDDDEVVELPTSPRTSALSIPSVTGSAPTSEDSARSALPPPAPPPPPPPPKIAQVENDAGLEDEQPLRPTDVDPRLLHTGLPYPYKSHLSMPPLPPLPPPPRVHQVPVELLGVRPLDAHPLAGVGHYVQAYPELRVDHPILAYGGGDYAYIPPPAPHLHPHPHPPAHLHPQTHVLIPAQLPVDHVAPLRHRQAVMQQRLYEAAYWGRW